MSPLPRLGENICLLTNKKCSESYRKRKYMREVEQGSQRRYCDDCIVKKVKHIKE